ncbi:MAG: DNA polymerase III subunit alpha, partial [Candidatus Sifarchaeia archaeon]
VLAEKVDAKVNIDYHAALLPHVKIPKKYENEYDYLKALCYEGWAWREMERRIKKVAKLKKRNREELSREYKKRLLHELRSIEKQKMVSYFLIVYDICRFAREQRIMVGPGRGSAAGSLVSFLLGITSVDPIEHDLLFERFMNPDRIDTADIDLDFEKERRQEILDYLRNKYGHDRVAQIANVGTLAGKQCLKDVSRVLGVPFNEANSVTDHILERASGDERAHKTVVDSFKKFEPCQKFNDKYPKVLPHAAHLEGMAKSLGIHAAGCVVAPDVLADMTPLEIRKYKGQDLVVTALDMRGVAAIGLVKLDILGLKMLTILRECLDQIERIHNKIIDLEKLDLWGDEEVLDHFTSRDFSGIFQFDTPASYKLCDGIQFESFSDIPALNALNRPGPARSGLTKNYVERKKEGLEGKKRFHEKIEHITADTLGVMTYQEHVNRIFIDVAGFKPGKADTLRRDMAKSKGEEVVNKVRDDFIEGAMEKTPDMSRKQATRIMNAIKFFGGYSFNKSHATAYGIIAYWGMYLKAHYPVEFYWSLLKNEEKEDRIKQYTKDARRRGIEIIPPNVSVSGDTFTIDRRRESAISGGLLDIKGVGVKAVETIVEHQPFKSFTDLLTRVNRRSCHKGVVNSLLIAGALDDLIPNRRWLVKNYEKVWKMVVAGQFKKIERLLRLSKKKKK